MTFLSLGSRCQNYRLKIQYLDTVINQQPIKVDTLTENYMGQANNLLNYWNQEGFIAASYNCIMLDSATVLCSIELRHKAKYVQVESNNVPDSWPLEFRNISSKHKLTITEFISWKKELIKFASNNGFPFASAQLTQISKTSDGFKGLLDLSLGFEFTFNKVLFTNEVNVNASFIEAFLGVKRNQVYKHKSVLAIDKRLSSLTFLTVKSPTRVIYSQNGEVTIILNVEQRKISSASGIIGIAQSTSPAEPPLITGELDMRLRNLLGRGISFDLDFSRFQSQSQSLSLSSSLPYLFGSSYEVSGSFLLEKYDTTFFKIKSKMSLSYLFTNLKKTSVFYSRQTINSALDRSRIKIDFYGLSTFLNFQDRLFNPRRGFLIDADISFGSKTSQLEDLISKNSTFSYNSRFEMAISPFKNIVLLPAISSGGTFDPTFVINQSIWLGGLNTFRGINQQSLPVQHFVETSADFRLSLGSGSFIALFSEWLNFWSASSKRNQGLLCFGAGYNFEVGTGVFTINYSLSNNGGSFSSVANGIVTFGVSSYF